MDIKFPNKEFQNACKTEISYPRDNDANIILSSADCVGELPVMNFTNLESGKWNFEIEKSSEE